VELLLQHHNQNNQTQGMKSRRGRKERVLSIKDKKSQQVLLIEGKLGAIMSSLS
jgi:hypothetical protein